jgi:uncharacterized protein Yka (UPF0111/DUF47 family)
LAEKTEIIKELGVDQLLLPRLISEALVANDRAKYYFALVQMAKAHADNPSSGVSNLQSERLASGVSDAAFDRVVGSAVRLDDGRFQVPLAGRILGEILSCIDEMMRPLKAADTARQAACQGYRARVDAIKGAIGAVDNDSVSASFVDEIASGQPSGGDSLHLVVMELHRELNALQSAVYQESVEGATVYGIGERGKALVSAFMKGVNQTSKLKFDHPGLGTTATSLGEVLMIQNDVGQTEAHVLVIRVKGRAASVTCSDVHRQRILFLRSMLAKYSVTWGETTSKESKNLEGSGEYYLSTGVYEAKGDADLEGFLTFLGSRLVFLIDWNRARKQLRLFLTKGDALDVLRWAAENNYGHMGFLKMGGDKLVLGAIEELTNVPLRFGDQFYDVLGKKRACEFLKFVLAACSEGLTGGKSEVLIRDEVRAELAECFHSVNEDIMEIAAGHSSLVVEMATAVRDDLVGIEGDDVQLLKRNAERGKRWESEADALLNKARLEVKRSNAPPAFEAMLSHSDDAADSLEDSLFLLSLIPREDVRGPFYEPLVDLAEVAARASMEFLKSVEGAKTIHKWSPREEIADFLEAVDKVVTLEHDADDAHRRIKEALMASAKDFRQAQAVGEISKDIEQSTDDLMKSAITLKDYVLQELVGA